MSSQIDTIKAFKNCLSGNAYFNLTEMVHWTSSVISLLYMYNVLVYKDFTSKGIVTKQGHNNITLSNFK